MSKLSEDVTKLATISLDETINTSMKIARELVAEKFNMDSLADVEARIMDVVVERMRQLNPNINFEDPLTGLYLVALVAETSLYLGINIGRNSK